LELNAPLPGINSPKQDEILRQITDFDDLPYKKENHLLFEKACE
jgi:hypothetical protein